MRFIQNVLLILGAVAVGVTVGFFAVALLLSVMQPDRHEEPWTRAYGQFLGGMICGAPLGGIVGIVFAIVRIRSRDEHKLWGWVTWGGILSGLMAGPLLSWRLEMDEAFGWLGTACVTVASGAAGGMAASLAHRVFRAGSRL